MKDAQFTNSVNVGVLLLNIKISELKVFNPAVTNLYKDSSSVPASTHDKTEGPPLDIGGVRCLLFAIRLQLVFLLLVHLFPLSPAIDIFVVFQKF